jgi:sterol desaturase/sphingolipid hydroxylase (fatty acid hydroxylase superfamily)
MEKDKRQPVDSSATAAPPMFKYAILNRLAMSNPPLTALMYVSLSVFLNYYYYNYLTDSPDIMFQVRWFVIGFFSWTFAEYMLHRFVYHDAKDASYMKGLHYILHGVHHKFPNDSSKVVLPPAPSIVIATVLTSLFYISFYLITGDGNLSLLFVSGFLIGYLIYMLIHYMVHKYPTPKRFKFWWMHHNIHHFQQYDRAFGVSTPIWDIIFRTMPEKGRKTTEEA